MASGNGSNAQALVEHGKETGAYEVVGAVTDMKDAYVKERMAKFDVPCEVVPRQKDRNQHDLNILSALAKFDFDWIVLAGYMRILSDSFLQEFWDEKIERFRIINIHPSKLPLFPGIRAYEQAFESGNDESGITVHFVDEGVDTGPVILQKSFPRLKQDSFEEFKQRGMQLEHQIYKEALEKVIREYP